MNKIIGKIKKPSKKLREEIIKSRGIFTFVTHLGYTNSDGTIYIPKYLNRYETDIYLGGTKASAILISKRKKIYLFGDIPEPHPYKDDVNDEDMIPIDYYVCPNEELANDLTYVSETYGNNEWICTDINGLSHRIDRNTNWQGINPAFMYIKYYN